MKTIVLCTGGFDPLHSGHIEYFKAAKALGDKLVVALNSDKWLTRKKGRPFMDFDERANIIKHLNMVDQVIGFDDSNDTACNALFYLMSTNDSANTEIIFANGGDRFEGNCPEYDMYKNHYGVSFAWNVGGGKKNSSSLILEDWKHPRTERTWGWYRVLDVKEGYKVKELVIDPGKSLSDQKHKHRAEHWYVLKGTCNLTTEYNGHKSIINLYQTDRGYIIDKNVWHKATNFSTDPCHVLEVQYGEKCVEEDIVRRD